MKIIHTADIHLDSAMTSNFDKTEMRNRRAEILVTFQKMVEYAVKNDVKAIIIAGDLFDTRRVAANSRNVVLSLIKNNPHIDFYYLKGNHDAESFLSELTVIPHNLKIFGNTWTSYVMNPVGKKNLILTGAELTKDNSKQLINSLVLDRDKVNIVTLHGQIAGYTGKNDAEVINLPEYKNCGIDYMALGHIHMHEVETLDTRGIYVYPGCLEGRGFDECGEHGFELLEFDEVTGKLTHHFVPFARKRIYDLKVNVSGVNDSAEAATRVQNELEKNNVDAASLVRVRLSGEIEIETELDVDYLQKLFEEKYYIFRIQDETTHHVDYEEYRHDVSLKGEFVRTVGDSTELSPDDAAEIIKIGIDVLSGEEVAE